MIPPGTSAKASLQGAYVFQIYVAGGAPNSVQALANLYAICRKHFPESHRPPCRRIIRIGS